MGETSRPVNLRIHMFGNWCRFFFAICDVFFYIYFSLCIFFKHLFLMFGEFIHPHLPGTLTSTTTMGVCFFYYYYFYLVICLNSGFLGKYYFYFLFWLKIFSFHFFLLFTFIRVEFFVLLFLSCTYAWKYRFTRSFLSLSGDFQRFPPLCFIMLNIFSHTLGDFVLFLVFIVLLLNFSLGFISFFDFLLIFFFEIKFSFFLSRRFFSDVGFFLFYFFCCWLFLYFICREDVLFL